MERLKLRARLVERTLDRIDKEKERARRVGDRARDAGARAKDAGARAVEAGADAGRWFAAAPQRLSEMSGEVRDSLREKADDFDADELWDRILEDVRGKADDARDAAREGARRAKEGAQAGARAAREKAEQAYEHVKETDLRDMELGTRAAALGAWFAAVPKALAEMPPGVIESLSSRRGGFSAEALWDLIPNGVKTSSDAVQDFLARHLSHLESAKNSPGLESDIANVAFERSKWNLSRGSKDMTGAELARLRLDNFAEGVLRATQATGRAAARGALMSALLELPVTAAENLILVKGNGKTVREASLAVVKDLGKSAAAGGAGAAVMTGVAVIGVPTGAFAAPLAVVGGIVYLWSATGRVKKAYGTAKGAGSGSADCADPNPEGCGAPS